MNKTNEVILSFWKRTRAILLFDKGFTARLKSVQEAVEVRKTFQNKITIN